MAFQGLNKGFLNNKVRWLLGWGVDNPTRTPKTKIGGRWAEWLCRIDAQGIFGAERRYFFFDNHRFWWWRTDLKDFCQNCWECASPLLDVSINCFFLKQGTLNLQKGCFGPRRNYSLRFPIRRHTETIDLTGSPCRRRACFVARRLYMGSKRLIRCVDQNMRIWVGVSLVN